MLMTSTAGIATVAVRHVIVRVKISRMRYSGEEYLGHRCCTEPSALKGVFIASFVANVADLQLS
jgi:hypothetical protein